MHALRIAVLGNRILPPLWWHTFQADMALSLTAFLLQTDFWFWVQIAFLVIGIAWCVAMVSTLLFGGWYAYTHPTTGNDLVIRRLAHLLRFLTFGLTHAPSPDLKSEDTSQEAKESQDAFPRSLHRHP